MLPGLTLRQAEYGDGKTLAALAIQVWLHTYATDGISTLISNYVLSEFTAAKFEALMRQKNSVVFVAERARNLIGYAALSADANCPVKTTENVELRTLYTQAPFIGTGVGYSLLCCAEKWALQQRNTGLWLTVNSKNIRAIAFYKKQGYQSRGTTHFQLGDEAHENLVLTLNAR
jgi:diamine N-acetyltransferase